MANEYLTSTGHGPRTARLWRALPHAWLAAYGAVWVCTLCSALLVVLLGAGGKEAVRGLLRLCLQPRVNAPPSVAHVVGLLAHNLPIAAWPVLLGMLGAHRHASTRRVADVVVIASLLASTVPVGAALGAYGAPLVPYLPQLPLEWAGLGLGASAWLVQRRRALRVSEGLGLIALTGIVLVLAAALETNAVPHR
jgi:hypothetical protein